MELARSHSFEKFRPQKCGSNASSSPTQVQIPYTFGGKHCVTDMMHDRTMWDSARC